MPNGMSEEAQSRGHAVWEGAPCKGALYPIICRKSGCGFLIQMMESGRALSRTYDFDAARMRASTGLTDVPSQAFCAVSRRSSAS